MYIEIEWTPCYFIFHKQVNSSKMQYCLKIRQNISYSGYSGMLIWKRKWFPFVKILSIKEWETIGNILEKTTSASFYDSQYISDFLHNFSEKCCCKQRVRLKRSQPWLRYILRYKARFWCLVLHSAHIDWDRWIEPIRVNELQLFHTYLCIFKFLAKNSYLFFSFVQ